MGQSSSRNSSSSLPLKQSEDQLRLDLKDVKKLVGTLSVENKELKSIKQPRRDRKQKRRQGATSTIITSSNSVNKKDYKSKRTADMTNPSVLNVVAPPTGGSSKSTTNEVTSNTIKHADYEGRC
jgi:hypothetical protein